MGGDDGMGRAPEMKKKKQKFYAIKGSSGLAGIGARGETESKSILFSFYARNCDPFLGRGLSRERITKGIHTQEAETRGRQSTDMFPKYCKRHEQRLLW